MAKKKDQPIEETPVQPLEGQTAFPGFDEPEQAPDAEAIDKAARKISFQMDFMRDPEDALAAWGAPSEYFRGYLASHFDRLVAKAAKRTGADPEQIRDKNRRTPEQQALLTEIAGQEMLARHDRFINSLYFKALILLDDVPPQEPGVIFSDSMEDDVIKEQSVIYFFAVHGNIKPLDEGSITPAQQEELTGIYKRLDAFYRQRAAEIGEENVRYGETLSAFIRQENPVKSKADSILEKIPMLQSINPTAHTMPNNALMNALQQKSIIEHPEQAQGWDLPVANAKGRRKEISSFVMATYDPGETGVTMTGANLTEYERQVSDAVVSLFMEATSATLPPVFTPDMIYRSMPGGSEKASPQQKGAITRTMEKFRRLHITVDATEEMRKRGLIGEKATYKLDAFYLNVTHAEYKAKNGGQVVNAYRVESEPIILTYAKMTNQLLTVPAKYLAIEKVKKAPRTGALTASGELITMTAERQAMTGYLLRRIAIMKHDKKNKVQTQSNNILFSTLFRETGNETENRKQAMINRNFCLDVLDYWKATGWIKGYSVQEKGRSITGVTIDL